MVGPPGLEPGTMSSCSPSGGDVGGGHNGVDGLLPIAVAVGRPEAGGDLHDNKHEQVLAERYFYLYSAIDALSSVIDSHDAETETQKQGTCYLEPFRVTERTSDECSESYGIIWLPSILRSYFLIPGPRRSSCQF